MRTGNTTLVLESTYIDLGCSAPKDSPKLDINYHDSKEYWNGTFHAVNMSDGLTMGMTPQWTLAIDVSIDPSGDYSGFPALYANAPDIEADQGTLLFQSAGMLADNYTVNKNDSFQVAYCKLSQIYVESNVTCTKSSGTRICAVTAQRSSQL